MKALDNTVAVLDEAIMAVGRVAAWLVLVHALVVGSNVMLRYVFNTGAVWAQELEWHLLAPIIMLGIPYAIAQGEIVRIDTLYGKFSARWRYAIDVVSAIIFTVMCVFLLHVSIPYAYDAYVLGEASANPNGLPHRFVVKAFVPIGFLLMIVQAVSLTLKSLLGVLRAGNGTDAKGHDERE